MAGAFPSAAWYVDHGPTSPVQDLSVASNTSGATLTLSMINWTIPAGALICVLVTEAGSSAMGTLSDGTNTYSLAASQTEPSSAGVTGIFYAICASPVVSGTLTYTKDVSGAVTAMAAFFATNIAPSSPLDTGVTATASGTSASPSVTSGGPSVNGELLVGGLGLSNSAAALTYTQQATPAFNSPFDASSGQHTAQLGGGFLQGGSTNAVTFSPTLSAAPTGWAALIVGFKPAVSAAGWNAVTPWSQSTAWTVGTIVKQLAVPAWGNERCFICYSAGTGGASEPSWTLTQNGSTTDGSAKWIECTGMAAVNGDNTNTPTWSASKATSLGQIIQNAAGTYLFICTTSSGNTGSSQPSFNTTTGAITSDGSNVWTCIGSTSAFTKWGAPHARLLNAINWSAAGNSFYVASEHQEFNYAVATSLAFPGTAASPNLCLTCDKTSTPPGSSDLTTGASLTTLGSAEILFGGYFYMYGMTYNCASGTSGGAYMELTSSASKQRFHSCALNLLTTVATSIGIGSVSNGKAGTAILYNTTCSTNTGSLFTLDGGNLYWSGPNSAIIGTAPTTLFEPTINSQPGVAVLDGVDISVMGSGKTLVGAIASSEIFNFINCKLGSGVTVAAAQTSRDGARVFVSISDSANTTYRQEKYDYTGTLTTDTTDVRSGGASDGTTPIAWKVVTSAGATWWDPFECFEIDKWCGTTGSPITVSIPIMSNATLTSAQVWPEVSYLGNASYPIASLASGGTANPLAAGASWALDGSSSWTTTGVSGPVLQTLSATFTPQQVGYVRVKVAVPSQTLRIAPLLQGF